jgi:hypothetical protein
MLPARKPGRRLWEGKIVGLEPGLLLMLARRPRILAPLPTTGDR